MRNGAMCIYKRHRFTPEMIRYAVQTYYRFNLGSRDNEDLFANRGLHVPENTSALAHHTMQSPIGYLQPNLGANWPY